MIRTINAGGRRVTYTLIQTLRPKTEFQALPEGKICVYAPRAMRLKDIDRMVADRAAQLTDAIRRLDQFAPDGATIMIEGVPQTLPADVPRAEARSRLSALALRRIRARVTEYASRLGVRPGRVAIREQKRRWGSCTRRGNLNFNWKLIMAPPQALEYVVIHELCHLREFNHSPRFWALVEAQMPDYAVWKKWLWSHGGELEL